MWIFVANLTHTQFISRAGYGLQDINEINPVLWNYNAVDCASLSHVGRRSPFMEMILWMNKIHFAPVGIRGLPLFLQMVLHRFIYPKWCEMGVVPQYLCSGEGGLSVRSDIDKSVWKF